MKKSLLWLRGAREMLGLPAWSEHAERAYFDALALDDDESVLLGLRMCLRRCSAIPSPLELRKVASHLQMVGEVPHG